MMYTITGKNPVYSDRIYVEIVCELPLCSTDRSRASWFDHETGLRYMSKIRKQWPFTVLELVSSDDLDILEVFD